VLPSDCVQVTFRVSVAAAEQVLESALQVPVVQVYVQLLIRSVDCVKDASVPQLKLVVGVQASEVAGAEPVQLLLSTVEPSER
jgi:hypothetical protein